MFRALTADPQVQRKTQRGARGVHSSESTGQLENESIVFRNMSGPGAAADGFLFSPHSWCGLA